MLRVENVKNRFFLAVKTKSQKKDFWRKFTRHEAISGLQKKSLTIKSCAKEGKQGRQAKITQYRKPPSSVGAVSVPILDFFA
jgi:hypothetical protein